ncbi:MAG TPA: DUF3089 domain-containing protein, partial [Acidimicrobiales bacterium]|nr:DUF3089 domain-containing protein [Acidimicrobiales bacterium]
MWLCRPGLADDPCTKSLSATAVNAAGKATLQPAPVPGHRPFDCFYVYPTVSMETGSNANLEVQPAEVATAEAQASRFSAVCNVWAPMYRQRTLHSLAAGLGAGRRAGEIAYRSLLAGWDDYLARYNEGRPILLLGHSQGAAILIQLLRRVIDPDAALRRRLVGAIILGGNVEVPTGRLVGGSFRHIPLCSSPSQAGCVIAYSTFPSEPPPDALFGRPGQGVSLQWGATERAGLQVACVNPAAVGSTAAAPLDPYFPANAARAPGVAVTTPWVAYPGR